MLRVWRATTVDEVAVMIDVRGVLSCCLMYAAIQVEIQDQKSSALVVLANSSMEGEVHLNTLTRGLQQPWPPLRVLRCRNARDEFARGVHG